VRRAAALLAIIALWVEGAGAAVVSVTLAPPARDFGYFVGDTLMATAWIRVDGATRLDRTTLPERGPASPVIDVRRVELSEARHGAARTYRIDIEYQNFFSPEAATQTVVPPYRIAVADGATRAVVTIPGWRFMVSPLRHDVTPMISATGMRGDHPVAHMQAGAAPLRLGCALVGAGLALLLLAWNGIVAGAWGLRRAPFAHAVLRIRRLPPRRDPDNTRADTLRLLHRAFDATAGWAVLAEDVDRFLARHARFAGLRPEIERFFAMSRGVFFQDGGAPPDAAWLLDFGRRLSKAERP
jgi:mxaA protein